MGDGRPFEVVAQFWHPNDAAAYLSALANEDIHADLLDDNLSALRTGLEFMAGGTKVIVAPEDADRAREILTSAEPERAATASSLREFSQADLTRSRIGRECPACGSTILASPSRPALGGAMVLGLTTALVAAGLPVPAAVFVIGAAAMIPVYYLLLLRMMPMWRCKECHASWEMPRG